MFQFLEGAQLSSHDISSFSYLAEAFIQSNLQLIKRSRGQSPQEQCGIKAQQLHGSYCGYTGAWTTSVPVIPLIKLTPYSWLVEQVPGVVRELPFNVRAATYSEALCVTERSAPPIFGNKNSYHSEL